MPLGQRLPGAYRDWRVVEDDLHDIARRMREYDPDARLVRQDQTGHLGIAVERHGRRKSLMFARELFDLTNDTPLIGCPDGRVLACQRAFDSRRVRSMRDWYRRMNDAEWEFEDRREKEIHEDCGDQAEQMAYRMARDAGATNRAYVPRSA